MIDHFTCVNIDTGPTYSLQRKHELKLYICKDRDLYPNLARVRLKANDFTVSRWTCFIGQGRNSWIKRNIGESKNKKKKRERNLYILNVFNWNSLVWRSQKGGKLERERTICDTTMFIMNICQVLANKSISNHSALSWINAKVLKHNVGLPSGGWEWNYTAHLSHYKGNNSSRES